VDPAHILDLFGSMEVGAIAYSVDAIGGYVFHDHIVPEVIGPADGAPADTGLLLLTSTARDAFPAIRYASGDIISGFAAAEYDDRLVWRYEAHLGRTGAELKHGEMLSLHSISLAMSDLGPGVTWDVRRAGLEVVIDVDQRSYTPALAAQLRSQVRRANPAVDRMIASGLVGDIGVEPRMMAGQPIKRVGSLAASR
jgi:hypothetical protein